MSTRHVEHCMGTVFSLVVADPGDWSEPLAEVVRWLHRVDELFSTYRPLSEVSRLREGSLTPSMAHPLVREVLALCAEHEQRTGGAFTAHLPGGLDPSGLVKGWAVERASDLLRAAGSSNHAVNGGGDVQLAGERAPGEPWRTGIADPRTPGGLLAVVSGRDLAVATSGTAERGPHLVDPRTGRGAEELLSVTVVGSRLTRVDVDATAAFVLGPEALEWLEDQPDTEGLVVTAPGEVLRTSGFREA